MEANLLAGCWSLARDRSQNLPGIGHGLDFAPMELGEFQRRFAGQLEPPHAACQKKFAAAFQLSFERFVQRAYRTVIKECPQTRVVADPSVERDLLDCLARLQLFDLYLTAACCAGDEAAWKYFYEQYQPFVRRVALAACSSGAEAEDLAGAVIAELSLPSDSNLDEPKLAMYSGIGSLQGWLRVLIGRRAIDLHRRSGADESFDDPAQAPQLQTALAVSDDPEERITRNRYSRAASEALRSAMAELNTQEQLLLVLYYRDGLTLKEIAELPSFQVHEATISRRLEKVHRRIRKEFQDYLRKQKRMSASEISECSRIALQTVVIDFERCMITET